MQQGAETSSWSRPELVMLAVGQAAAGGSHSLLTEGGHATRHTTVRVDQMNVFLRTSDNAVQSLACTNGAAPS